MRKYMKTLLPLFVAGESKRTATASTEKGVFRSHSTSVAIFRNGEIFLRSRKFSATTSTQQNAIREFAASKGIPLVECDDETFYSHFHGTR